MSVGDRPLGADPDWNPRELSVQRDQIAACDAARETARVVDDVVPPLRAIVLRRVQMHREQHAAGDVGLEVMPDARAQDQQRA